MWIDGVRESVGPIPVYALGNKVDLKDRRETTEEEAIQALEPYECPILYTSAKTGVNVEQSFQGLAKTIVETGLE
jgi:GTPase SAR1 family protein